jgi:hypothetical protein
MLFPCNFACKDVMIQCIVLFNSFKHCHFTLGRLCSFITHEKSHDRKPSAPVKLSFQATPLDTMAWPIICVRSVLSAYLRRNLDQAYSGAECRWRTLMNSNNSQHCATGLCDSSLRGALFGAAVSVDGVALLFVASFFGFLFSPRREDTTEGARSASRIGKRRIYIGAQNPIKEAIRSYFKGPIRTTSGTYFVKCYILGR